MAEEKQAEVICANPDCDVAKSGNCVEGVDLNKCPHFGHPPTAVQPEAEAESRTKRKSTKLPVATTLAATDAISVVRATEARVLAIIGLKDVGKTSLIASFYDLFQEKPSVNGIEYARSSTLHAFELACHDARAASNRDEPHMERTGRGEVRFYHLDVGGGEAQALLSLILADRAGEEYREAADDPTLAEGFSEISRADSVTLLIDGERMLDEGDRHNVRGDSLLMLQGLIQGGAISQGRRLAAVLTKLDLVEASEQRARVENDFEDMAARIRQIYGATFSVVETFKISASPRTNPAVRGKGIPELLAFWLKQSTPPAPSLGAPPQFKRAFSRLCPQTIEEAE